MADSTQEAIEAMRRRYRDEALAAVSRAREEGEARGRAAALEEVKPKLEKERANTKEELGRLRDQVVRETLRSVPTQPPMVDIKPQ